MKNFAAAVVLAAIAGTAGASTISIQTGDTFSSNLGSAAAYESAVDNSNLGAATTIASYDNLKLSLSDASLKSTITFYLATTTTFDFRAGVDFGGGGALVVDNTSVFNGGNMWWNGNYNTPSQYLALDNVTLSAGDHTLTLYGFEDCCSGNTQLQYSTDKGAQFTSFSTTDNLPAIPEAQNAAMLLAGLALVGTLARRRKQA